MGARQSTSNAGGSLSSTNSPRVVCAGHHSAPGSSLTGPNGSSREHGAVRQARQSHASSDWRHRARSLNTLNGGPQAGSSGQSMMAGLSFGLGSGSPDSDTSIEDIASFGRVFSPHSLPVHLVPFNGIKCPVCSKIVLSDDVECHLVMCLTKPRISYNDDILTEDKGECVICLEELNQGDAIARLPCLCIYHKTCIDSWFEVNRSCPEHPAD